MTATSIGAAPSTQPAVYWIGSGDNPLDDAAGLAIARTAPPVGDDGESYGLLLAASDGAELPSKVTITSTRAPDLSQSRAAVEVLERAVEPVACPAFAKGATKCARTKPLRLVFDDVDRRHPLLADRSIVAELGGSISVSGQGISTQTKRVEGALGRQRAQLRVRLVRMRPKDVPPIGANDEDALRLAREEIDRASLVWSTCGVSFGPSTSADVAVVDPPPSFLISLGCEAPSIATGGDIRFTADGREVSVAVSAGTTPRGAARLVEAALDKMGFRAKTSDNRATHAATQASSDVLVYRADGNPATLAAPKQGAVSSDAALDACIGSVRLEDGLQHFTDADAIAGTLEERTLVKAFDDGDPATLEVLVIPSFAGDGRIGESFIFLEHGAIRNVVLEDRAGLRAQKSSFTLAHELGHVLLDQPGHPDDFAGDSPSSLMDADAVNPTAFGPRRLSLAECRRADAQSGAKSLSRALSPWPLAPVATPKKAKAPQP